MGGSDQPRDCPVAVMLDSISQTAWRIAQERSKAHEGGYHFRMALVNQQLNPLRDSNCEQTICK